MPGAADSWYHEKESAWLYRAVAAAEPDPVASRPVRKARPRPPKIRPACWLPSSIPTSPADFRSRAARPGGGAAAAAHPAAPPAPGARRHEAARPVGVQLAARPPRTHIPTSASEVGGRHTSLGGNNLRAAVFGASDGLVSNAALVMGVAAAGVDRRTGC